ncbi:hypothetical protein OK016_17920 [Vibrio chagasii]|nr:hypothetical protein [Vibrio chagasii]
MEQQSFCTEVSLDGRQGQGFLNTSEDTVNAKTTMTPGCEQFYPSFDDAKRDLLGAY